jgi:transcriptional regulator with XRE-family HTH domain
MSLGDELRYLRAFHGGGNLQEIEDEIGLEPGTLRYMEQRYRRVGEDDELLARIAAYYGVPVERLQFHRERYRKALSIYLHRAQESGAMVRCELRTGETLTGKVRWWDLGAFGLDPDEGGPLTIVQRHSVLDWPLDKDPTTDDQ